MLTTDHKILRCLEHIEIIINILNGFKGRTKCNVVPNGIPWLFNASTFHYGSRVTIDFKLVGLERSNVFCHGVPGLFKGKGLKLGALGVFSYPP
jgi:hypothetical protein